MGSAAVLPTPASNLSWKAATSAVTNAANTLKEETIKAATFAEAILFKTSVTESKGVYTIKGPFAFDYTFCWREILMFGGVASSVILATSAFFSGSILTGIVYLYYTALLMLGSYWLSQWAQNLTAAEIFEKARAAGIATIDVLKAIVGQFTGVLEGHGKTYATQLDTLQTIYSYLDKNAAHLKQTTAHLDKNAAHLKQTTAHLDQTAGRLEKTNELLDENVRSIPKALEPFIAQTKETLGQSKLHIVAQKAQISLLKKQTERLEKQIISEETLFKHITEQVAQGNQQLGILKGQVQALETLLADYHEALRKQNLDLMRHGENLSKERELLTTELGNLHIATRKAQEILDATKKTLVSFSPKPDRLLRPRSNSSQSNLPS